MHRIRPPELSLVLALCVATACGADATDADDGGGDPVGGPENGTWRYVEDNVEDGCKFNDAISNGGGDFGISDSSAAGFRVIPDDGTPAFGCDLDGNDFTCDERLVDSLSEQGVTIEVDVVASGRLASARSIVDGSQDGTVTCKGSNCGLAAAYLTDGGSFPCSFSVSFTADRE